MANQMATEKLANVVYLDRPAAGWFVLDVMRREHGKWDWAALMVDFDPDEFLEGLLPSAA